MNLENINLLSQRVDGVLATVRNLRQEVATLKQTLEGTKAELEDKNLLLANANAELTDCKAALTARANQAAAQDEALNQKQGTIDELQGSLASANTRIAELEGMISEKDAKLNEANASIDAFNVEIRKLYDEIRESDEANDVLRNDCAAAKANEVILNGKLEEMRQLVAEKDSTIEALNAEKASLNETIKEQGEEILQAQEQFKQMVSTIENELGTEIPVRVSFADDQDASTDSTGSSADSATNFAPAAEPAEEPTSPAEPATVALDDELEEAKPAEEPEINEPVLDFAKIEEEDEPIEIHPANEKEPDLFASNGGSPTGFFG